MRLGLLPIGLFVLGLTWPFPALAGDDAASAGSGAHKPSLVHIPPGTVVGKTAPKGWSHLIVKSLPRLGSGDRGTLPGSAARTATLFRTVILADVGRRPDDPDSFELRRIGIGLSVPDRQGRDVVVEPGRGPDVGVDLGLTDRVVLRAAEGQLARGKLAAATTTFALYRAPSVMAVGDEHHEVEVCYGLSVDPDRGGLAAFVWAQDLTATGALATARVIELPPNLVYECPLDVKAQRILGAVPVSWSFAMTALPPGRGLRLSDDAARILAAAGREPIAAANLERVLRRAAAAREDVSEPPSGAPSGARAGAGGSDPGRSGRTSTSGSGRPGTTPGAR